MGNDEFVAAERISMLGAQAKRPIDKKPQNGVRLWVNLDGCRTLAHWLEEDPELRLVLRLDDEQLIAIVDPAPVIRDGFLDLSAKKLSALLDKDEKLEDLCFDNRPPAPNNVPTMPSPKPPAANVAKLVEGNTRFALSLLRQLSKPSQDAESKSAPKNLFFSPYSLSIALAMTLAGARGETAKQMASTLEFQLDAKALHPAFASLAVQLDQAGVDRDGTRRVFELVVANSLWPAKGLDLHAPYLELAKRYYAVAIEAVDFAHELEAADQTINDWVSTQTRERIPSVLDTRAVSPVTLLVLTNAVYFNAKWKDTFEPLDTRPQVFHAPTGDVQVPMMSQRELLRAAQVSLPLVPETDGAPAAALSLELLEMPYEGERMALTVLMPSEGSLAELVAALSVEELAKVLEQLESEHLALSFPKFELRSRFQLSDTLSAMGMVDAFGPKADFKGITNAPLCIDKVMHEATIELDERGTIAAAATAIVGVPYGLMKPKYRKLEINRPFLYLIRDTETGTILFVGLLYDPS
jgi:serpin B